MTVLYNVLLPDTFPAHHPHKTVSLPRLPRHLPNVPLKRFVSHILRFGLHGWYKRDDADRSLLARDRKLARLRGYILSRSPGNSMNLFNRKKAKTCVRITEFLKQTNALPGVDCKIEGPRAGFIHGGRIYSHVAIF